MLYIVSMVEKCRAVEVDLSCTAKSTEVFLWQLFVLEARL